ncbi:MAG: hypothetical protein ABSD85_05170 [Acidimicrobiales bacterium]|jgi:hypothetical protein
MTQVLYVASYRFRVTFARRCGGYASVALLIALTAGIAMGSIAAAAADQIFNKDPNT